MGTDKDSALEPRTSHAPPADERGAERHPGERERSEKEDKPGEGPARTQRKAAQPRGNNLRRLRVDRMMSKAELARRAGVSTLTIDRVERGLGCRMDTKRKILEALGFTPQDRVRVFGEDA